MGLGRGSDDSSVKQDALRWRRGLREEPPGAALRNSRTVSSLLQPEGRPCPSLEGQNQQVDSSQAVGMRGSWRCHHT
jgi:hypothetical protein